MNTELNNAKAELAYTIAVLAASKGVKLTPSSIKLDENGIRGILVDIKFRNQAQASAMFEAMLQTEMFSGLSTSNAKLSCVMRKKSEPAFHC